MTGSHHLVQDLRTHILDLKAAMIMCYNLHNICMIVKILFHCLWDYQRGGIQRVWITIKTWHLANTVQFLWTKEKQKRKTRGNRLCDLYCTSAALSFSAVYRKYHKNHGGSLLTSSLIDYFTNRPQTSVSWLQSCEAVGRQQHRITAGEHTLSIFARGITL